MEKYVLSVLVENHAGVLSRVSGLFSRRGYNIDSLTVGVTENPELSRMTVAASGDDEVLDQIEKQVAKLEDVLHVQILDPEASIQKEFMLVKLRAMDTDRQRILSVTEIFHGKVVDVTHDSLVIEVTGNQDKLTSFLNMLDGYEILELARTGLTGLTRGTDDVYFVD